MSWAWKDGASFRVPAPVVGEAVKQIEKANAICQPRDLVDAARPESSELHPLFEWRDDVAGEAYRVHQARKVLSSLRVVRIKGQESQGPAFLPIRMAHAPEGADQGYVSMRTVLGREDLRLGYARAEWKHIRGCIERNAHIPEFAPLREAIPLIEAALYPVETELAAAAD